MLHKSFLAFALLVCSSAAAAAPSVDFADRDRDGDRDRGPRGRFETCEATNARGDIFRGEARREDRREGRRVACDRAIQRCRDASRRGGRSCRIR